MDNSLFKGAKRWITGLCDAKPDAISRENDERVYGNLPGVESTRTGTLGLEAERCDYYIRKV